MQDLKPIAYPLLILGLLALMLAKGCNHIAQESAQAAQAKAELAKSDFQYEWQGKRTKLEQERRAIQDGDVKIEGEARTKELDRIGKDLAMIEKDMKNERNRLEAGSWRSADYAADHATNYKAKGDYWRAWLVLIGSLAVVLALPIIAFGGVGPERWGALALLAIVFITLFLQSAFW